MKKLTIALAAAAVAALGTAAWAQSRAETEEPEYKIISQEGAIEIREYAPMIVAEATVSGQRGRAMNQGFRIIADYIFGNNISSDKVAMTAPVTQQASEEIAMTSPVTQQQSDGSWKVRFVMPAEYTMETLPVPVNPAVSLIEVPSHRVAAIRFSGRAQMDSISQHEGELVRYLSENDLTPAATPTYAFYDAPWTPSVMRRNEVLIELVD